MPRDHVRPQDYVEQARDQAEHAFEHARDVVEDGLDEAHRFLKRQWRERPVAVAASALGIGVILGLLIGGGNRR